MLSQEKYDVRKNNNAKEKMSGKNMVSGKKINVVRKNKCCRGKIILPEEYLPGQFRVLVPDQRCSLCGGKQLFVAVDGVVLHGAQQHLLGRDFFDQGLASFGLRKVIRLQGRDSTTKVVGLGLCTGSFRLHPSHLRARQGQLRQIVPPCLGHACC